MSAPGLPLDFVLDRPVENLYEFSGPSAGYSAQEFFHSMGLHNFFQSLSVGQEGILLASELLHALRSPIPHPRSGPWHRTVAVKDVSAETEFQKLGFDLLWFVQAATCTCPMSVEVKADKHSDTGNFFFETISDVERRSPGAFLSSTAEWYFYVFPKSKKIYCLPLFDTREWFLAHQLGFEERTVSSSRSTRRWKTTGCLIPIERVMAEVPGVRSFSRRGSGWQEALWNIKIFEEKKIVNI